MLQKCKHLNFLLHNHFSIFKNNFKNDFSFFNLYLNKIKIYTNYLKYNFKTLYLVNINNSFKNKYQINFNINNISKYLNPTNNLFIINFLRKNKVFNKGRYSRNRQYYRTGVYWCLYINIVAVIGMYFWFYRINMNFSYLWWFFYLSLISLFLPKIVNTNIVSYNNFFKTFYNLFIWLYYIIIDLYNISKNNINKIIK